MKTNRITRIFHGYTITKKEYLFGGCGYEVTKDNQHFGSYLTLSAARLHVLQKLNQPVDINEAAQ